MEGWGRSRKLLETEEPTFVYEVLKQFLKIVYLNSCYLQIEIQLISSRKIKEMETPFIKKIKKILEDPDNFEIISWNQHKTNIQIKDEKLFEEKVLARYFRHARISSFIRQLNLYGFKKIRSAENRTFTHSILQKGQGFDAIINKKKKTNKSSYDNIFNQAINIERRTERHATQATNGINKSSISDFRISQNPAANVENQAEEKQIVATSNVIPIGDQYMNGFWVYPMSGIQPIMQMPFSIAQDGNFSPTYNFLGKWW